MLVSSTPLVSKMNQLSEEYFSSQCEKEYFSDAESYNFNATHMFQLNNINQLEANMSRHEIVE